MRASVNIVSGQFFGAEIEPGTFHQGSEGPVDRLRPWDEVDSSAPRRKQGEAALASNRVVAPAPDRPGLFDEIIWQ